jgi:hypothetical protein
MAALHELPSSVLPYNGMVVDGANSERLPPEIKSFVGFGTYR